MERKTRFELATLALARRCSTAELLPQLRVRVLWRLWPTFLRALRDSPLRGNASAQDEIRCMSDGSLVFVILLLGGIFYMVLMLWTTVASVRESDANNPPPKTH